MISNDLKIITDALEENDFKGALLKCEQLSHKSIFAKLYQSYCNCLITGAYFPALNPQQLEDSDIKSLCEESDIESLCSALKNQLSDSDIEIFCNELSKPIERRKFNPANYLQTLPYSLEAIKEITDHEFISLFEVAALIGYRIDNDPRPMLIQSVSLFTDAIVNRHIDPRHPSLKIPFSKLPKKPTDIGGEIIFMHRQFPDMEWKLTLKEAAEFAILKGYPEPFFSDLLNDSPYQHWTDNQANNMEIEPQPTNQDASVLSDIKPPYLNERHPMFSEELGVAIKAWEAVLCSNPKRPKIGSRKDLIKEWLDANFTGKGASDAAKERIATMINPDKSGGVTGSSKD
ncbi:MAG: hypothetical protein WCS87_01745 [Methylococcaceae bacterium]